MFVILSLADVLLLLIQSAIMMSFLLPIPAIVFEIASRVPKTLIYYLAWFGYLEFIFSR